MRAIDRRLALRKILGGTAALAISSRSTGALASVLSSDSPDAASPSEREQMARVAADFMTKFDVPALSVAIARNGRLVYENPFGFANRDSHQRLTTSHLFRIASVTKPITSVTIFSLIEKGQLRLDQKVFGANGVLGTKYGTPPYKPFVEDVTIDHLLTHTAGGWDNTRNDPMFSHPSMDQSQLISWTLDNRPLVHAPGSNWAYSNFGYCVLGRVIEHVTQHPYSDYVREHILAPCGVRDMRIAGNTLSQRLSNEVVYYGQGGENPYDMNVTRMDSHGGWLATPRDLVFFLNHVDGFKSTPNILKLETIKQMITATGAKLGYARGWAINELGNWWHNGSLPGTTTIMVHTTSGFCWAALTNTRTQSDIGLALDNLVWDMARKVPAWNL